MNIVGLVGRVTKDIEVRQTNGGLAVAEFNIAVNRRKKAGEEQKTDFPRIRVWGKTAQNCAKYSGKGLLIDVRGELQTDSYQNKDGVTVYTTLVNADSVEFLEFKKRPEEQMQPQGQPMAAPQNYAQPQMQAAPQQSMTPQRVPQQPMQGQPMTAPQNYAQPQMQAAPQQSMAPQMVPQQPMQGQPMAAPQQPVNGFSVTEDPYKNF